VKKIKAMGEISDINVPRTRALQPLPIGTYSASRRYPSTSVISPSRTTRNDAAGGKIVRNRKIAAGDSRIAAA
jgi:hypothetical protein